MKPDIKKILATAKPAIDVKRGDTVTGKVYNITEAGAFVITEDKNVGFIHRDETAGPLKPGVTVSARVTYVRPDGRINLSLRPQKEIGRVVDAEKILEFLRARQGSMPYSDETPPEVIREKFGISKAAFKRALGKLFRDGVIEEHQGWISLTKQEDL
ncbi:MAG: S1 RNA-binding domain-containing protein [Bacillota bacterium]